MQRVYPIKYGECALEEKADLIHTIQKVIKSYSRKKILRPLTHCKRHITSKTCFSVFISYLSEKLTDLDIQHLKICVIFSTITLNFFKFLSGIFKLLETFEIFNITSKLYTEWRSSEKKKFVVCLNDLSEKIFSEFLKVVEGTKISEKPKKWFSQFVHIKYIKANFFRFWADW